jgi:hypothetical protein
MRLFLRIVKSFEAFMFTNAANYKQRDVLFAGVMLERGNVIKKDMPLYYLCPRTSKFVEGEMITLNQKH